ncbi:MAG: type II toxin-antitoxin system HicB family antitoxin [Terracidiphilus sp.]
MEIDFEMEEDGRWIAEIPDLPGVLGYGSTRGEAEEKVRTLAQEVVEESFAKRQ